jgi:hypothetical protein
MNLRGLLATLALLGAAPIVGDGALSVWRGDRWVSWFRADSAPTLWSSPLVTVTDGITWSPVAPGIDVGRLRLSGPGEAWRVGVVLTRIDPRVVRWRLAWGMGEGDRKNWTIDRPDSGVQVALNAGMFTGGGPFGWTVVDGVERGVHASGALAPAFVVDREGSVALVPSESLWVRSLQGGVALAFQSYPELLRGDGEVPPMLRKGAVDIDLTHRDARLAIGELRDGKWLIALTRFEGAGGALSFLPFGLTVPEMSALMGALGCRRAVSLDGGVSAQLRVGKERWPGLRKVALGLEILPRGHLPFTTERRSVTEIHGVSRSVPKGEISAMRPKNSSP